MMLDDLRSSALEEKKSENTEKEPLLAEQFQDDGSGKKKLFGMSPVQRFILAILLLLVTCILGTACLLIFGKINLPL